MKVLPYTSHNSFEMVVPVYISFTRLQQGLSHHLMKKSMFRCCSRLKGKNRTVWLGNKYWDLQLWVSEWVKLLSCVLLFVTPWTLTYQAPLTMQFSRQGYWSGLPFPTPGIFSTQGLNLCLLCLLHWQVEPLPLCHLESPKKWLSKNQKI